MGHRHVSHKSPVFEADQDQNHNRFPAEQPYNHMGRVVPGNNTSIHPVAVPGNSSLIHPVAIAPRGSPYASQWDSESRQNHHSSSSIGMEVQIPHAHAAVLGSSYDPFHCLPAPGGDYLASDNSAHHAHSNYYNRQGGVLDHATGTGRGPLKRKGTGVSVACEGGSTSRYLSVGSSSSSQQLEKPNLNHHIYPPVALGLPHHTGSSLSVATEDSLRNVRPRLDVEPNPRGSNLSCYSSHHYHSATELMTNPGTLDLSHMNADTATHDRNGIYVTSALRGRFQTSEGNGYSQETNQFSYGGSTAEMGGYQHESISRRNPVPSQYPHAPSAQASREGRTNYSRRVIPTYRTGPSYPHLGHEAPLSENGLQFPSETYSSRNSRPSSSVGWHHNHRNGRSRMAIERFESLPSMVDVQERMGSEALLMLDRSSFNDSRNLFDQYRELRLDIDEMSYEELLALGERIGNVSTGVSECMISKCLMECSSDKNQEEANCAICLEEYSNKGEVGTLKKCGHSYHVGCIKKWLSMKNVCPICKAPALADSLKEG